MRENRAFDELRPVRIHTDYFDYADGSAFIEVGKTRVAASATVDEKAPPFLKGRGTGWVTAEYSMIPCATEKRTPRERTPGKDVRAHPGDPAADRPLPEGVTDMAALGELTIMVDCDVLQADGGTRTASVTAGCVALALALKKLLDHGFVAGHAAPASHRRRERRPGQRPGALSTWNTPRIRQAELDMNVVETDGGQLVEVQAAAEKSPFSRKDFAGLMKLADKGANELIADPAGSAQEKKHALHGLRGEEASR